MTSFLNDASLKAVTIARFGAHTDAERVSQGGLFVEGSSGFIGSAVEARKYPNAAAELGWPEWLVRLADSIFDGLPESTTAREASEFGAALLEAVPLGVDLEALRFPFLLGVQQRCLVVLESSTDKDKARVMEAVEQAVMYLEEPTPEAAWNAELSARTAEATARVSQGLVTQAAAWSAWSAVTSVRSPWAVSESARSATRAAGAGSIAEFQAQRDSLIALVSSLPSA